MSQQNTLQSTMSAVRAAWGPLSTELIEALRFQIQALAKASPKEPWLAELHREQPARRELYRDPDHGFLLLAHFEAPGLYRPPHDHGRSWVIYALQQGESEMGSYGRVEGPDGPARLVKRDATRLKPGDVQVYLPGDIHDTLCLSGPALLFRFTERDLAREDLTRYGLRDGFWSAP